MAAASWAIGPLKTGALYLALAPAAWWTAALLPYPAENSLHDTRLFHPMSLPAAVAHAVGGLSLGLVVCLGLSRWRQGPATCRVSRLACASAGFALAGVGLLYRTATAPGSGEHGERVWLLIGAFVTAVLIGAMLLTALAVRASFQAVNAQSR